MILLMTLCAALLFAGAAAADDSDSDSDATPARFAGTYLTDFTPAGPPFKGLFTLGDDGTMTLTNTTQFGAPNMAVNGFNSTSHGAWRQSDGQEIESTVLFFDFDPDGIPVAIARVRSTLEFDSSTRSFTGVFLGEVFTLAQDPLDPAEVPVATFSGTMTGRRVEP